MKLGIVERSNFVKTLSNFALHGALKVPKSMEICENALKRYEAECAKLNELFYSEAATFAADENMQEKIARELWKKLKS